MMKKTIRTRLLIKVVAAAALCSSVVFADWFEGEPVQQPSQQTAPVPAAPAPAPAPAPVSAEQPAGEPVSAAEPAALAAEPAPAGQPSLIIAESTMRLGTEISAAALASAPYLHFNRKSLPGSGRVMPPKDRTVFQQFDRVTVKPTDKKLSFKEGDTVDVLNKMRWFSFKGKPALLTARVGRGVVVGYAGNRAVVSLHEVWGTISGGESIAKTTPFTPVSCERLEKAAAGSVKATVVLRVEDTVTPYLHQYLIIDKGSSSGVNTGDFFRVTEKSKPNRLSEGILKGQVVSVSDNSSTLVIQKMYKGSVNVGDEAVLSFKAEAR